MHRFTRIAGAVSLALALPLTAAVMAALPYDDPIRGAAHGAVFGADGKHVQVTPEFIARAQSVYLARALEGASVQQRARYDARRAWLEDVTRGSGSADDRQSALVARSLLLDWLIGEVGPADAAHLRQRNNLLVSLLRRGLGHPEGAPYVMQPHEQARFRQGGVSPQLVASGTPPAAEVLQARETYAKKCKKAGVPVPPTWGKAGAAGWTSRGVLADPFISTDKLAEVFVYQSATPQGVCLALPRYKAAPAGAQIELLGIICMGTGLDIGGGNFASNACFWDNQKDDKVVLFPRTGEFPINTNFAAGEELDGGSGGTCTACHAGENAFIIHPEDPAFQGIANLKPKAWYKPMVAASWPQNPGPNTKLAGVALPAGQDSCLDCHGRGTRLPEIVKAIATPAGENYCDAVLTTAIDSTMPPGAAAYPDPDYKTHTDFLLKECADAKK